MVQDNRASHCQQAARHVVALHGVQPIPSKGKGVKPFCKSMVHCFPLGKNFARKVCLARPREHRN
eukprot:1222633-Amphidinium_carterae.1